MKSTKGRKPVKDKKRPIRIFRKISEIRKLGGEEKTKLKINAHLDTLLYERPE